MDRAISARKRCAAWFEKTGDRNKYSNAKQAFFIDILQKAADTLKSEDESDVKDTAKTEKKTPASVEVDAMRYVLSPVLAGIELIHDT